MSPVLHSVGQEVPPGALLCPNHTAVYLRELWAASDLSAVSGDLSLFAQPAPLGVTFPIPAAISSATNLAFSTSGPSFWNSVSADLAPVTARL